MIKIIAVGKIKKQYLVEGINDYLKMLSNTTEIIEIPESNLKEEGEKILENILKNDYVISLTIQGNSLNSLEFSKKLEEIVTYHSPNIVFVIGSSLGLSEKVINSSHYELSFSKFTFPHQLFRLILLEQIYRAKTISSNHPYHK
jgi:23S rRNA (pseudouridine1915-N3)-methyltransferase